jgi:hypothetical protein
MNSFKIVLLAGVLGMTWVDCGRRPEEQSLAFPETAFEAPSTNVMASPPDAPHAPAQRDRAQVAPTTAKGKFTLVRP